MTPFAAILPAAGASARFGANKLTQVLCGQTVIGRSIAAFTARPDVPVVVVAGPTIIGGAKIRCVPGGACRAETVRQALQAVPPEIEWVAIHDAARPLISQQLIDRVLAAALIHGAAGPAVPVALTIKQCQGPLPAPAGGTVAREQLWAMQTPQIMRRQALLDAFERCPLSLDQITDDLQVLELAGQPVWLVDGEERNLKITRPLDLEVAAMLLSGRQG